MSWIMRPPPASADWVRREQASHDFVIRREHPERLPRLSGVRRDDDRSKGLESEAEMDRGWLRQNLGCQDAMRAAEHSASLRPLYPQRC